MKVLVCGGSRYQDRQARFAALDRLHADHTITQILNGGARGADYLASAWAKERGIDLKVYKADHWNTGLRAFTILNAHMLDTGKPDLVLAFPGGAVTDDLCKRAKSAGIKVEVII